MKKLVFSAAILTAAIFSASAFAVTPVSCKLGEPCSVKVDVYGDAQADFILPRPYPKPIQGKPIGQFTCSYTTTSPLTTYSSVTSGVTVNNPSLPSPTAVIEGSESPLPTTFSLNWGNVPVPGDLSNIKNVFLTVSFYSGYKSGSEYLLTCGKA